MRTVTEEELKSITFGGLLKVATTKRVYKYISYENGLEYLITNNSIKFSDPNDFNDPFDCNPILFKLEIPQNEFDSVVNTLPYDRKTRRFLKRSNTPENALESLKYKRRQKRIYSFTRDFASNLMWSHYGDNHKGLCIGFEFPIKYKDEFVLYPVNYPDSLEVVRLEKDTNRVLYYWLTTKLKEWKYEEEIRAIHINNKDLCTFSKNHIKEVIFGNRVPKKNIIKLQKRLRKLNYPRDIELNRIVINEKELKLEKEKIST